MLPSCGYFRDMMCPFLKLGYCERTHCHYKHASRQPTKSWSVRAKSHTSSKPASLPVYVPTPVAKLKCANQSSKDDTKRTKRCTNNTEDIPVYKPTPISELKKKQIGSYGQNSCDIQPTLEDNSNNSKIVQKEKTIVSNVIKDTVIRLAKERKECDNILVKTKKVKLDVSCDDNNNKQPLVTTKLSKLQIQQKLEICDSKVKRSEAITDFTSDSDEHVYDTNSKKIRTAHNSTAAATGNKEKRLDSIQGDLNTNVGSETVESRINSNIAAEEVCNSVTGKKRIAHKPKTHVKRPTMPIQFGNKVPMRMRQLCLNKIIDELLTFCLEKDAYKRGLDSEQAIYEKSRSSHVYKVFSAQEVAKIRSEAKEKNK